MSHCGAAPSKMPPEDQAPQPIETPGDADADRRELERLAAALTQLAARAQAGGQRAPARPGPARGSSAGGAERAGGSGALAAGSARGPAAPGAGVAAAPASAQPALRPPGPAPAASAPAAEHPASAGAPRAPAAPADRADRAAAPGRAPGPAAEPIEPARMAPLAPDLEALRALVQGCTACGLCRNRTRTVFGDGPPQARLMFVGEAPGAHEEASGLSFAGEAGQLLTRIIEAGFGLPRAQVYIANGIKCRPPDTRDPSPEEKHSCLPFLERQIELVDPLVLVALGSQAANLLLGTDLPLSALRGRVHPRGRRFVVPTFHPADLLRNPESKRDCWADVQQAMALLGLTPRPGRGGAPGAG